MSNEEIRKAIRKANIKYWQLADRLGVTPSQFSVLLRKEFLAEDQEYILNVISEMLAEKEAQEAPKAERKAVFA